jgi:DNA-binding MarR family transcriptional regulator
MPKAYKYAIRPAEIEFPMTGTKTKAHAAEEGDTSPGLSDDIALIGRSMGLMRLMIGRRIIGRIIISKSAPGLEISHLDVIEAVRRIKQDGEVTVGAIAETMRIDPSRGSRLVADLVQRGMLRRDVSQADARRSVVELTDMARDHFRQAEIVKRSFISSLLVDWDIEDVHQFAKLYERFVTEFEAKARSAPAE